jgi:hypothetical protein
MALGRTRIRVVVDDLQVFQPPVATQNQGSHAVLTGAFRLL